MGTSSLGHYTRFDEANVDGNEPADTGIAFRALNNLNHLADQYAQTRVSWTTTGGAAGLSPVAAEVLAGPRYWVWKSSIFDLHVDASGSTYPVAAWVRIHSGHAERQAVFYLALVPAGGAEVPEVEMIEAGANVGTAPRTSTTFAWEYIDPVLSLSGEKVARSRVLLSTVDSPSGPPSSVEILRVRAYVYCSISLGGAAPRLGGVRIVEFRT